MVVLPVLEFELKKDHVVSASREKEKFWSVIFFFIRFIKIDDISIITVESTLPQKCNVVRSVDVFPHHWNEKWRLRSVQVVASSSIWNHSELFNQMDEV